MSAACLGHKTTRLSTLIAAFAAGVLASALNVAAEEPAPLRTVVTHRDAAAFVKQYCVECHGEKDAEGDLSLHRLAADALPPTDATTWKQVFEKLESREMPPSDAAQPSEAERSGALARIKTMLKAAGVAVDEAKLRNPSRGNWVDHASLFAESSQAADAATTERVWRVTGPAYMDFVEQLNKQLALNVRFGTRDRVNAPWQLTEQRDFTDYSTAHRISETDLEAHLRNCEKIAPSLIGRLKYRASPIPELSTVLTAGTAATDEQLRAAVAASFDRILSRGADADELKRYGEFLRNNLKMPGGDEGMQQFVIALLFHPSVLYRIEAAPADGRRGLMSPRDMARAVALTVIDREPDAALHEAVVAGKPASREDVERHVTRILADKSIAKPRIVQFFREYFGYGAADDVFKDGPTLAELGVPYKNAYEPNIYIADADRLVAWVLENDRQVLRELLTTPNTFALVRYGPQFRRLQAMEPSKRPAPAKFRGREALMSQLIAPDLALETYEISLARVDDWAERPYAMPAEHRMGLLTHPAWLIAQSGNFDNHAIHRGRWIREKLLGGRVPEVPITVNAMLPDEPGHTLRDRMQVTRDAYCWKCHKQMDPLGLPFEQFDHVGRYRTAEQVVDVAATEAKNNLDRNGVPRRRVLAALPLNTTGMVEASGDPQLDGPVKDPFELIRKLANSEHVEQVFVRHAFRFFLGRNETLADGPTLRAAHRAYRHHNGSMNALITSLLTSDSFLYRAALMETDASAADELNSQDAKRK